MVYSSRLRRVNDRTMATAAMNRTPWQTMSVAMAIASRIM